MDGRPHAGDAPRTTTGTGAGEGIGPRSAGVTNPGPTTGSVEGTTRADNTAASTASDPLAPPTPRRTVVPGQQIDRVVTLSSADLDVVHALGAVPTAAWATEGTKARPWRRLDTPRTPRWNRPGAPSLASLLPFAPEAIILAAADVTADQMRGYEQIAAVVAHPAGRPGWAEHLELVAAALDRGYTDTLEVTTTALEAWATEQRDRGARRFAVVLATGARPDTPVATLSNRQPLAREIEALGFGILAHDNPVPYRELRTRGVQVVRIDPRNDDIVTAARQPSALSLPWLLPELTRGRSPSR